MTCLLITASFGTRYTLSSLSGLPSSVTTSATPAVAIAPSITYKAFGPVSNITTSAVQPAVQGGRTLKMVNDVGAQLDYRLNAVRWHLVSNQPLIATIAVLDQSLQYTASGLLQARTDIADSRASRYYGYDASRG